MNPIATAHGDWRLGARQLRDHSTPFAIVTVVHARGSVPRDVGTRMLVTAQGIVGTIGGGHLEFEAIAIARQRLVSGETDPHRQSFALGARLGQCCGGAVDLLFECDDPAAAAWAGDVQQPPVLDVWLHGAGHVGRALVAVLALLPCRVTWLDGRADAFPDEVPPNVRVLCSDEHAHELDDAPPDVCHLVMTHSHALDFELSLRILRRADFRYFGLIGSATKRRSFEHRLVDRGIPRSVLSRMRCPIGIDGVSGKEPGVIAVAVAAQLLGLREDMAHGPDPMGWRDAGATSARIAETLC